MIIKRRTLIRFSLLFSINLFILSLTQKCFCTNVGCVDSIVAFFFGTISVFLGGCYIVWIANPLLILSWITITRFPKTSFLFGICALLIALSFLFFDEIQDFETGKIKEIIKYKLGYWIWVLSILIIVIGQFSQLYLNKKRIK